MNELIQQLRSICGAANVLTHDDPGADLSAWEQDWRKRSRGRPEKAVALDLGPAQRLVNGTAWVAYRADPDSPIICADEDEFMQAWEQAQEQGGEGDDDDDDMDDDWAGGDS